MRVSIPIIAMVFALSALRAGAHDGRSTDGTIRTDMVIYFGDLNLSSESDARILLERIERGAKKACGGQHAFSSYTGAVDKSFDECRAAAVGKAIERLNAQLVTRVYAGAVQRQ
jgi:UrcA family protein